MNQEPAASFQRWLWCLAILDAALILSRPAAAQETKCPRGSACATISINGKQLPPPPQKFEGKIGRNIADSKPYWPTQIPGTLEREALRGEAIVPQNRRLAYAWRRRGNRSWTPATNRKADG